MRLVNESVESGLEYVNGLQVVDFVHPCALPPEEIRFRRRLKLELISHFYPLNYRMVGEEEREGGEEMRSGGLS